MGGREAPHRFPVMTTLDATSPRRPPPRRRRSTRLQRRQTRLAWLMLMPALALVAFVALYPLGQTVYDSFTNRQFLGGLEPTEFVGLENYRDLIHDTVFRDAIWVTVKFTVVTVSIELVLGMIIALAVNSGFRGRGVMRAMMLIPWAIPTVVAAQMWKWMYDDVFGVINDALVRLHIVDHPVAWISQSSTALWAVSAVDIWKTTPFVALLLLAGLQVIPHELYEAADVDGVSKWRQYWRITLPLLMPAILVTVIFRTLDALRVFDVFYVFFGSRLDTQTMAIYAQNTIVSAGDVGYGAAISVGIFFIIALFVVIYTTFMRVQQQ
jgi:trehalose/maltose transport system permease protein